MTATLFIQTISVSNCPKCSSWALPWALPQKKTTHVHEQLVYNLLSSFDYMSSTPTLFNAGTLRPQLSSCFLTTVPDDLHGIYGAIKQCHAV